MTSPKPFHLVSFAFASTLLLGCASNADEDHESASQALRSIGLRLHTEGSPEALAILRAANEMIPDDLGYCATSCETDRGFFDLEETSKLLAFRAKELTFTTLSQLVDTMAKGAVDNSQYVQARFLDVAILRGWYQPFDEKALLGLSEGSPEATGIVRVANEMPLDRLGRGHSGADFVMLDGIVADAISSFRKGADGTAGTSDDAHFTTLGDIRATLFSPEVQRRAAPHTQRSSDMYQSASLAMLLRMAKVRDLLGPPATSDPFDPASCQGAGLTLATAKTRFGSGQATASLGDVTMSVRLRGCNPISGCSPWAAAPTAPFTASSSYRRFSKSLSGFPEQGRSSLIVASDKVYFGFQTNATLRESFYPTPYSFYLEGCELGAQRRCRLLNTESGSRFERWGVGYTPGTFAPSGFDIPSDLANTITDHCVRLVMTNAVQSGQSGTEYQLVVAGRY